MSFLHSRNILHHELKTKTILVDDNLNPKISEFGFFIKPQNSTQIANESFNSSKDIPYHIAPEILKSESTTKSSDVYSFGFIVYEIICNEIPFSEIKNRAQLFDEVVNKGYRPSIKDDIPLFYSELISSCWNQDPNKRPTFESIVGRLQTNDEFITNCIDKNEFYNYIKLIEDDI